MGLVLRVLRSFSVIQKKLKGDSNTKTVMFMKELKAYESGSNELPYTDAQASYADAQFVIGLVFYEKRDILLDMAKAVYWFKKAADNAVVFTQFLTGGMYLVDDRVEQNFHEAKALFQASNRAWRSSNSKISSQNVL